MHFQFYFKNNFIKMFKWIVLLHVSFHTSHVHGKMGLLFILAPKSSLLCHHCVASVSTIGPQNENWMLGRDDMHCRESCWWESQGDALYTETDLQISEVCFPMIQTVEVIRRSSCGLGETCTQMLTVALFIVDRCWANPVSQTRKGNNEVGFVPQWNIKQQWKWSNYS